MQIKNITNCIDTIRAVMKCKWLCKSHLGHLPLLCSRQYPKFAKFQRVMNRASSKRLNYVRISFLYMTCKRKQVCYAMEQTMYYIKTYMRFQCKIRNYYETEKENRAFLYCIICIHRTKGKERTYYHIFNVNYNTHR